MRPEQLPPSGAPTQAWEALPEDAVEIAQVLGAWGIAGQLKVRSYSASADALFHAHTWFLQPRDGVVGARGGKRGTRVAVAEIREHGDLAVVRLTGVDDRDAAQALRGATVWVARAEFPPAEAGEYYWVDLIGARVCNRSGCDLGAVTDLIQAGPQEVLVVHDGQRERLIPFVDAYVDQVDVAARRIVVDWQPDY